MNIGNLMSSPAFMSLICWIWGALAIMGGVHDFKKRKYFWFGVDVMLTIHAVLLLISVVFFSRWAR